jgi:signal transduction histidine kinase
VPLRAGDRVIGDLGVVHERPNFFTVEHEDLVLSVANHIAIGIENARLFLEARERTRELASLLEVSRHVAGSRDTESLARVVLDEFRNVMDYGNASLVLREGPLLRIAYASTHDDPSPRPEVIGVTFEIANAGAIWDTLQRGEPLLVDDNRDGGHWSQAYQQVVGDLYDTAFAGVRSWMGVPLRVRGETIGFLTVSAPEPQQFRQSHTDLAMAFAAQVSVAFENAELLQQAQAVAATEERQRLARELHDSVSQALYGIALGARTARTQLDRDPAAAKEPVDYVLSLAEAGLAEMRALIFELRPESLETEGLVAALEKQVAATRARYGFEVNATLGDEPELPSAAREAFYRIAQEALHNIVKHARPSTVDVALASGVGTVELLIRDDGVGFDPAGEFPGHLGLQSMRERASRVGASLTIDSSIGEGTSVRLVLAAG